MLEDLTDRQKFILAALASEQDISLAPVQVQKLFFLFDENLISVLGKPKYFDFQPYDYGPYDKEVYAELEALEEKELVRINYASDSPGSRSYCLSIGGQREGESNLDLMDSSVSDYIASLCKWVKGLTFAELVGYIYKHYPEMRENSIFRTG